jgi:hypothetical protein
MVKETGPSIGTYRDRDIPAYIVSDRGRFEYDRIAVETDGGVDLSQLARDECVIAPGLIYRAINRSGDIA